MLIKSLRYVLVRVKFALVESWLPNYDDRESDDFKLLASQLQAAIEDLYKGATNDVDNFIYARVVEFK